MNRKILFVDDDVNILNAHQRNLRSKYDLLFAKNGAEGIQILNVSEPVAAVVSDFRMPEMDGINFLSNVRKISKDTVRIMLTGYADVQAAINAVNEGNIFRFLTKPCPSELLIKTLDSAIEQYKLVTAEKELLDQTLKGTLKILIDILAVVNPSAFSKAGRMRNIIKDLGKNFDYDIKWKLEIAALLSQIGCITLPTEILDKYNNNIPLSPKEDEIFQSHPQAGCTLLSNIPRLEEIAEAIAFQDRVYKKHIGSEDKDNVAVIAKLLKHAADQDKLNEMEKKKPSHTMKFSSGIKKENGSLDDSERKFIIKDLSICDLLPGMILVQDVLDRSGLPVVVKGTEISKVLILRLANFLRLKRVSEPVTVFALNE